MGCCGFRERNEKISETQKWDYINLSDFKSSSCLAPFSYVVLYILLAVSIACYVIDLFTAVQLLIFDRWSGSIQPAISLSISRWIFLGCIIASYIFLAFRWWKALKAIKSGGIAQSYLDPLAVRLQSIRVGKNGRGWRRFLVFAEMTKGKKGADYIALFTYFSFEAWYRIIFAEAPRNVINAVTVYSVFKAQLTQNLDGQKMSPILQFFTNVKVLADGDWIRATVLVGMLFVLITWLIAAISLLLSCFFYVFFLWNHVSRSDKSLRSFCKRRVDGRLTSIVNEKVNKALLNADARAAKTQLKTGRSGENVADIRKAPTLPNVEPADSDVMSTFALSRQDTYSSAAPSGYERPGMLNRMDTSSSAHSYSSNAPLMSEAAMMGSGPMPMPSLSPAPPPNSYFSAPPRSQSPAPPRSYSPAPSRAGNESVPPRSFTPGSRQPFHVGAPPGPLTRQNTEGSSGHLVSPLEPGYGVGAPLLGRQGTGYGNYSNQGRSSPAPGYRPQQVQEFEMRSQTPQGMPPPRAATSSPFQPYNPSIKSPTQRSFTAPQGQMRGPRPPGPGRNITSPINGPPRGNWTPGPQGRPAPPSTYDDSIYDHY